MATTSPARTKKSTADTSADIELIGNIDTEDESFTAKIFGTEKFLFSTDVNGYLLLTATRGGDEFIALMDSLVLIPDTDGLEPKEMEAARDAERERFHSVLARQKHLSVERLAKFVGEMMEIAGNAEGESSSTD